MTALRLRLRRPRRVEPRGEPSAREPEFGEKPPYLVEYLAKAAEELGEEPQIVERLTGEMKKWRKYNLVYPVGGGIFIHVYTPREAESGYNKYVAIEPPRPHPRLLRLVEEALALVITHEHIPRSSEEKKALLLELLEKIVVPVDETVDYENLKLQGGRIPVHRGDIDYLKYHVIRDKIGVGILEPFLRDPYLEDITCGGVGPIYIVHKLFGSMETSVRFETNEELDEFVIKLGEKIGKPISHARPVVDATLPDGSRINIVFGNDVSLRGSNFTIRKVSKIPLSVTQLINWGTFDSRIAAYMWMMLSEGMSVFICGESLARGERVVVRNKRTGMLELVPIEKLEDRYAEYEALTLDPLLKFTFRPITGFIKHKPRTGVYKVVTESGRTIRVTGDHSLFTIRNFKVVPVRVDALKPGDSIVVPAKIPLGFNKIKHIDLVELLKNEPEADRILVESKTKLCRYMRYNYKTGFYQAPLKRFLDKCSRTDKSKLWIRVKQSEIRVPALIKVDANLAKLLGLYLSEGCITGDTVQITNKDDSIIETARSSFRKVFRVEPFLVKRRTGVKHLEVKSKTLSLVLRKLGLGTNAWDKRIPGFIYGLGEDFVKSLLGAYISGDASFGDRQIRFWSRSKELIEGLWLLLLGLGIKARYKVDDRRKRGGGIFHTLVISGPDLRRFAELIEPLTRDRKEKLKRYLEVVSERSKWTIPSINNDPRKFTETEDPLLRKKLRDLAYRRGGFSLNLLKQLLQLGPVKVKPEVSRLIESDIVLDRVKRIEKEEDYEGYVYDISVPGTENFVAGLGGILAHNTASGKTTSLNAIMAFIRPTNKIVTIEDTAEVVLPHPNWTRELTRDTGKPESSVTMFDLLKAALRQRPNYIIVGEIRGAEGNIAFQAMQSVTWDTPVAVMDPGGRVRVGPIGRFIDEHYPEGAERAPVPVQGYRVLSLGRDGRLTWAPVRYVLRHRADKVYRVRYEGGELRATGSHSVFVLDEEDMVVKPRPVSGLRPGDLLVVPAKLQAWRGFTVTTGAAPLITVQIIGASMTHMEWVKPALRFADRVPARPLARLLREAGFSHLARELEDDRFVSRGEARRLYARAARRARKAKPRTRMLAKRIEQYLVGDFSVVEVISVREEPYGGYVYDVSVPGTELFFGGSMPVALHNTGHPVMATFHAANLERLIQRLTNPPISVPKTNMDSLNIAWFQSAVHVKGFPARRVITVNEIIGYDPASDAIAAMPVFTWDPVEDRFLFAGRGASYLLEEKIAVMRGIPRKRIKEIYDELELRARFLQTLVDKKVFDYFQVYKAIVKAYSLGVEEALKRLEQDRLL